MLQQYIHSKNSKKVRRITELEFQPKDFSNSIQRLYNAITSRMVGFTLKIDVFRHASKILCSIIAIPGVLSV